MTYTYHFIANLTSSLIWSKFEYQLLIYAFMCFILYYRSFGLGAKWSGRKLGLIERILIKKRKETADRGV